ncbi:chondroitinase-B domain-containing protein [Tamlana sp. 2_MG-2023]|uniref:chondroitinase-B domain-containing protein n=1 Tax=unclassified Tamlana TaxID=2614803 RepID=UPI0026E20D61|nr:MULTISPECIES: chondroitinase-B domain-containing protein [unclassified Tamlana]MDO6760478.1 chondroitinase-B domain-containing protein [Tamlana sp. 2_MG-2023]MDO6790734.1 chondroitinase-B domain-containing protein [Tamlana sp. 1_MG-2023]
MNKIQKKSVQRHLITKAALLITVLFLSVGCKEKTPKAASSSAVTNGDELNEAIKKAEPGDVIVMSDGVWKDVEIKFRGKGTKDQPITIKAETAGGVSIEGESYLKFAGEYLKVEGLHFKNGHSPSSSVIDFRINENEIAYNCTVTNCVIEDFNQLHRDETDLWVQFWGRNNTLSNCYIAGKTNRGPTVRVNLEGIESMNNYHQIVNNHFGPRPRKGGASAETIQIGNSFTSMAPSYTMVENNLFEECNGEVEIISSKTNFNEFRGNVFYNSEGSLVTRHGNYCIIDGNYFINDSENTNVGGIRIVNSGHWVTNNYFFNIKGASFRSALAVMNGIPKSPQNRYNQVTDVVVAYNTYVNCVSPWQFGVGTNIAQSDVLPKSEIRSARPIRTTVANNVIYNEVGDPSPVFEHDKADGVLFKSNVINNQGVDFKDFDGGIQTASLELTKITDNIMLPTGVPSSVEPYQGFDFNTITKDLFGNSREENNAVGASLKADVANPNILDKTKYGADWYSNVVETKEATTHNVSSVAELQQKIDAAKSGDVIALAKGVYELDKSLKISKAITIQSPADEKAQIVFSGAAETPVFELNPKGLLTLNNVVLKGNGENYAFASLKENMSNHFGLTVSNCEISDFAYALRVYKEAFAENITFEKTAFDKCENGLELSEEINDKGDYNTEYLTITDCTFNAIKQNVVDYYRGGYDESTIGGNLLIANCTFTNSGGHEKNKTLLNHRGIVNVNIKDNTFKNNPVKFVSVLWGAKNNEHSNNTISNSGEIKVQENLEMKMMY